jgi:uncharacterized protein YecT (DUF1311 family)
VQWLNENTGILLPVVAALFTGIGYLIKRQLTGERHKENADSIEKAIQLKRLLDVEGMSIEDAKILRDRLHGKRGATIQAEAKAILARESQEISASDFTASPSARRNAFEDTTVGMSYKISVELSAIEGQLDYAVADMASVCTDARADALDAAQKAWEDYRDKEAEFAALLFEGGTGAPLLGASRKIELTELRLGDLRQARAEIENLVGK